MNKTLKIVIVIGLFVLLVLIRANEAIFGDPFIYYFKYDYLVGEQPEYNFWGLLLSHSLRYDLNAIISLVILYVIFESEELIKFSLIIYVIGFLVLFPMYYLLIQYMDASNYQAAFYVRRFLIHPIFVLILIPAFYYNRLRK